MRFANTSTLVRGSVLAAAGAAVLILPACSSNESANAFATTVNTYKDDINTVVTQQTGDELVNSLDTNLTKLQGDLSSMESAASALPDNLKAVGTTCVGLGQALLADTQATAAAITANEEEAFNAAKATMVDAASAFSTQCIDAYNNASK